ncbi:MAG: sulfotransferase [Fidelibacterota bacterium]
MKINHPILITGSHRSGTTWVGNVLKQTSNTLYLHEPLTPNSITRSFYAPKLWYQYFNPNQNYPRAKEDLDELFHGNYPLSAVFHFKNKLPHTDFRNPGGINDDKINFKYAKWRGIAFYDSIKLKLKNGAENKIIPLIKDPIALTAAEWLHKTWNTKNILLIRHPAAFVSSLKRLDWRFNFMNFSQQPDLMSRFFEPYRSQIENPPKDPIAEAALVWTCLTAIIVKYQQLYPNWIYIRHEDLSNEPIHQFQLLFKKLKFTYSDKIENYINKTTNIKNPSEVTHDSKVHQLNRDSRANIFNWKKRLTAQEIEVIRSITKDVSEFFYSDDEW